MEDFIFSQILMELQGHVLSEVKQYLVILRLTVDKEMFSTRRQNSTLVFLFPLLIYIVPGSISSSIPSRFTTTPHTMSANTLTLPFTTVDVFTTVAYSGSPLSIITLPSSSLTAHQLQLIAREFNLSEVVFLHPESSSSTFSRHIQIFTTENELPLAGHPVIGTGHYVLKVLKLDAVKDFETKGGRIPISIDEGTGFVKAVIPQAFKQHNGVTFKSALNKENNIVVALVPGMNFILVPLPSLYALSKAGDEGNGSLAQQPFQPELYLGEENSGGLIGTMYYVFAGKELGRERYRTRMFAHVEDSGSGSACAALGCWLTRHSDCDDWSERSFVFEQGVEMGRRTEIYLDTGAREGPKDREIEKVVLSGGVVAIMEGSLKI